MSSVSTIKIDSKGRGNLRRFAKPGQVYRAELVRPGQIVLKRMTASSEAPDGRLATDSDGMPIWRCNRPVDVARLMREVRDKI